MNLIDYRTGEIVRRATIAEAIESLAAATYAAGNSGAIDVDGRACYVDATYGEIAGALCDAAIGRDVAP